MTCCSRSVSAPAASIRWRAPSGSVARSSLACSRRSRNAVNGVRSWCDASPANDRWASTSRCVRADISLNDAARARISGGPLDVDARASRSPWASRSVALRSSRSGRVTVAATTIATIAARTIVITATRNSERTRSSTRSAMTVAGYVMRTAPITSWLRKTGTAT